MAELKSAGHILNAASAIAEGMEARKRGEREKMLHEFTAQQLEQNATQAIAASQRAALEDERAAKLVQSRTLAVSAASGAGASDPTIMNMMARQAGEGAYRASVDLYQGEESARKMRTSASMQRWEGEVAARTGRAREKASWLRAGGSLLGAGSSLSRYGGGGYGGGNDPSAIDWSV